MSRLAASPETSYQVVVCRGPYCGSQCGSQSLHAELGRLLRARGLEARVTVAWQSCFGRCARGPNVLVRPKPERMPLIAESLPIVGPGVALYNTVKEHELPRLLDEHVALGHPCRDLMNRDPYVPLPPGATRVP